MKSFQKNNILKDHFRNHFSVYIAVFCFATAIIFIQWVKFVSGRLSVFDLGVFDQAIWTFLSTGKPVCSINFSGEPVNWLGFHFSPLILVLSAVVIFFSSSFVLCAIQTLLVASTVVPIYLSGRSLGLTKTESQILSILFLFNPLTLNGTSWDFHEVCFAAPLIAWSLYAIINRRFLLLVIMTSMLFLVKENYGLAAIGMGFLWIHRNREFGRGIILAITGIFVFYLVVFQLMPWLSEMNAHPMLSTQAGSQSQLSRYGWIKPPFFQTLNLFVEKILLTPMTFLFLLLLLFSNGLLTLLGSVFLSAGIADFFPLMLSANPMPRSIFSYHALPLMPVIAVASVFGLSKLKERKRALTSALLITGLISYFCGPFPFPGSLDIWQIKPAISRGLNFPDQVKKINNLIPSDASISVQPNIGYFFSKRFQIHPFSDGDKADFIILYLDYPFDSFKTTVFANPFDGNVYLQHVRQILSQKHRPILLYDNGWAVFGPLSAALPPGQEMLEVKVREQLDWMESKYAY